MRIYLLAILFITIFSNCSTKQGDKDQGNSPHIKDISEDSLLTLVQYQTFNYFWEGAEPISGMARERIHMDGISPTAALSSFPYTPEESMQFLKFLYLDADTLIGKYGPYDAFSIENSWYLPRYLAIDQGPIPVMIENYRTGFIWDLFMSCQEIQTGLTKLGFKN